MAELIDKDEAKKEMWWLYNNYVNNASNFEPEETEAVNRSFGRLQNVIDDMPTTTEAEIRAKALDEFKELAFTMFTDFDMAHGYPTLGDVETILYDVAEQLKEET